MSNLMQLYLERIVFKKTSRKLDRKQNLKLGVKHNAVPSPRECLVVLALQTKLKAPPN